MWHILSDRSFIIYRMDQFECFLVFNWEKRNSVNVVATKDVLVLCDINSKAKEATKNSPRITNNPTWICIYLSTVTLCSQRDKISSEMLSCFVGEGTERRRKQGPLSPLRALTWSSLGATRDVFYPPSPTSGRFVCPQRLRSVLAPWNN